MTENEFTFRQWTHSLTSESSNFEVPSQVQLVPILLLIFCQFIHTQIILRVLLFVDESQIIVIPERREAVTGSRKNID